jgi:hypothetical protein
LKALLFSQQAVKVGYHVQGNLDILSWLWELTPPSKSINENTGWIDLGVLARSKGLIRQASLSLLYISQEILGHTLENLEEMRCSDWCRPDLSEDQKNYAIRNAWVPLHIFKAIVERPPAGARLSQIGLPGDEITLRNGSVAVAHGAFVERMTKFPVSEKDLTQGYISLSNRRVLVRISKILAPSFISHYHRQTLEELGPAPFDMVVDLASLVSRENVPEPMHQPSNDSQTVNDPAGPVDEDSEDDSNSSESSDSESDSDSDRDQELAGDDDEFESFMDADIDAYIATHPEGPETHATGSHHPLVQPAEVTGPQPTHTFQDIWHEMERLNKHIPRDHSLAKQFSRWLHDAMLVPDKIDKARVEAVLKKQNITWDQAVRSKPDWVWRRVRRYVPPPDTLIPILSELFKSHADLKCARKKIKLFDAECHKAAKLMIEDVRKGWVSDPPGVALYNILRTDSKGLPIYHDIRGTNGLEGGIHGPVRSKFGSLGASVEMTVALLSDFCYRKNVEVRYELILQ